MIITVFNRGIALRREPILQIPAFAGAEATSHYITSFIDYPHIDIHFVFQNRKLPIEISNSVH